MKKREAVVGFLLDPTQEYVLMMRKTKPDFMAGTWNGPGGKVEPGETPTHAMSRELLEETGVEIPESAWQHMLTFDDVNPNMKMLGAMFRIHAFRGVCPDDRIWKFQTLTEEVVNVFPVSMLPQPLWQNTLWMVGMAVNKFLYDDSIKVVQLLAPNIDEVAHV